MSQESNKAPKSKLRAGVNRELLHTILDTHADAVFLVDQDGRFHLTNSTSELLFGYPQESFDALTIDDLIAEEHRGLYLSCMQDPVRLAQMREEGEGLEIEALTKAGDRIPVELLINKIEGLSETKIMFVVVVRSLKRRRAQEAANKANQANLEKAVQMAQERARKQQEDLLELSTPTLEVWPKVILMPLIGTLDSRRTEDALEKALFRISETRSEVMLIDITGVPIVDTMVANYLIQMAEAVRLMGAVCILTGIRPAIAKTIVQLGVDLSTIRTRSSLAQGLKYAISLVKKEELQTL